jgi:N-acylneuraminate cytidylyltransferase
MFAYIPARGGSKRIPRKNVRMLGDKPLLFHVLDSISKVRGLNGIAVSTDDSEILQLVNNRSEVITLGRRPDHLANDVTGFMELVLHDVPRFANHFNDNEIMFVTATAALVPTEIFQEALDKFIKNKNCLVMGVIPYEPSAMLALVGNPESQLTPLFPEMYDLPTKDLPGTYTDAGCFYLMSTDNLAGKKRFLDVQPINGVILSRKIGIDLDTESDWARLIENYQQIMRLEGDKWNM